MTRPRNNEPRVIHRMTNIYLPTYLLVCLSACLSSTPPPPYVSGPVLLTYYIYIYIKESTQVGKAAAIMWNG
ncbi:hypothetical protein F4775DRAFT_571187 [Biscogniauxia sp. FL1348]|nr:hypothetical protein F4775DRAFT_571187 [Biscogniauxia sp. FL1348]